MPDFDREISMYCIIGTEKGIKIISPVILMFPNLKLFTKVQVASPEVKTALIAFISGHLSYIILKQI